MAASGQGAGPGAGPGINLDESPLARLATRKGRNGESFLAEAEALAGERLRMDFTRAGLTPGITQRWDGAPRSGGAAGGAKDLCDAAIDAKARVQAALRAVGPELSGVVLDVCCFLKGLEFVERERRWPVRSAKVILKAGLAALARHYGLATGEQAGGEQAGGKTRIRRWGAADYKPAVGRKHRPDG